MEDLKDCTVPDAEWDRCHKLAPFLEIFANITKNRSACVHVPFISGTLDFAILRKWKENVKGGDCEFLQNIECMMNTKLVLYKWSSKSPLTRLAKFLDRWFPNDVPGEG